MKIMAQSLGIDWSISIGNLLTVLLTVIGFVGTVTGMFYALRTQTALQGASVQSLADIQTERLTTIGGRMINLELEVKELKNVLVALAAQDARLLAIAQLHTSDVERMDRLQEQIDRINNRIWSSGSD